MIPNSVMQIVALMEIAISSSIVLAILTQALIFKEEGRARMVALRALVCFVLANLLFWPVFALFSPLELPLAAYVRAFTGELSITSMLLLWTAYFSPKAIHVPALMKVWIARSSRPSDRNFFSSLALRGLKVSSESKFLFDFLSRFCLSSLATCSGLAPWI
jgi:hypothetical protein